jgi:hypothetical protein
MRTERKPKPPSPEGVPDSWDWLDAIAGTLDEDFLNAALEKPTDETSARPRLRVNKNTDIAKRPKSRR